MSQKTHGGKRAGAGRPPTDTPNKEPWGTKLSQVDIYTLRGYPQARAASLLASGLRLGAGNVGPLSDQDIFLLRTAMNGTFLDALTVRGLADEVRGLETLEAAQLARRMDDWGDWELLNVALLYGD